jgi:MFS family permease
MTHDSPRKRTHAFREIIRRAGIGFFPLEFVAKLPLAMTLVGVLTMVTEQRGSIADAGLTSGTLGLASGICGPLVGAAADKWGQRRVLMPISVINGLALIAITAAVYGNLSLWSLIAIAILIGASSPQIGPMGRARWIGMMAAKTDARNLNAAMSWESMTDEVSFIIGPIVVAVLTSLINPAAPVIAGAVIVLIFAFGFAIHPTHHHAPRNTRSALKPAPLLTPRLGLVIGGMAIMGMFWGISLTTVTALADQAGAPGAGGYIYGAMGVTASITALATGAIPDRFSLARRWLAGAVFALLFAVPLLLTSDPFWIGLWYFMIGIGIGPILVTIFTLAASLAPAGRSTTVMTMVGSGSVIGQAIVTSINGFIVEQYGIRAGFFPAVALLAILIILAAQYVALGTTLPSKST